jgi:hypothetical protein
MANAVKDATHAAPKSEIERWAAVVIRSVHLAGVVWVGAFVVSGQVPQAWAAGLVAASGVVMLGMDLLAGRMALRELAGLFVLLKLALVAWMAADPTQARWVFWLLLIGSSITSHAPKGFRHWPTPKA